MRKNSEKRAMFKKEIEFPSRIETRKRKDILNE